MTGEEGGGVMEGRARSVMWREIAGWGVASGSSVKEFKMCVVKDRQHYNLYYDAGSPSHYIRMRHRGGRTGSKCHVTN